MEKLQRHVNYEKDQKQAVKDCFEGELTIIREKTRKQFRAMKKIGKKVFLKSAFLRMLL
jgi:hypothetical protein